MIWKTIISGIFNIGIQCNANGNSKFLIRSVISTQKKFKWFHTFFADFNTNKQPEINALLKKKSESLVKIWEPMSVEEACRAFDCDSDIIRISLPNFNLKNKLYQEDISILSKKLHKKYVIIKNPNLPQIIKSKPHTVFRQPPPKPENLVKRPPIVTVMGHVDHGKTTLLDSIRNTFTTEKEFGGITQHIGAFLVQLKSGDKITFIDTPGHAAFTTLRARGADITDLIVLVIAADDGVMEQTIESIKIANKSHVKMIVAVNKIDKPKSLNIESIKEKLLVEGIQVEDKGGDVQIVPISALKKINLDLLIEMILVEAELMNLKADPFGLVEGVIIESKMHNLGPVATVIVQRGTMKKGQILVTQRSYCKVKFLLDENGKECTEVFPSFPIQVFGWKQLPEAGDEVFEVKSEKIANKALRLFEKNLAFKKQQEDLVVIEKKLAEHQEKRRLENDYYKSLKHGEEKRKYFFAKREEERKKLVEYEGPSLKLIIKGDVHGTVEVLLEILNSYDQNEECQLEIVHASVGNITQNDIDLCKTFDAIIYAFNVDYHSNIKDSLEKKEVDVRMHNVIYKMVDDLRSELSSRIPLQDVEKLIGEAVVNQNFFIVVKKKKVPVAGCKCIKGVLGKNYFFRVLRDDNIIYEGKLVSMRHHKNEVDSIKNGSECGLMFDSFPGEFKELDKIICYEIIQVPRKTSWNPGF